MGRHHSRVDGGIIQRMGFFGRLGRENRPSHVGAEIYFLLLARDSRDPHRRTLGVNKYRAIPEDVGSTINAP